MDGEAGRGNASLLSLRCPQMDFTAHPPPHIPAPQDFLAIRVLNFMMLQGAFQGVTIFLQLGGSAICEKGVAHRYLPGGGGRRGNVREDAIGEDHNGGGGS